MMRLSPSSLVPVLLLAVACSDGPPLDPDNGAADETDSRTDIDLKAFRQHALSRLRDQFGTHAFATKAEIVFQDGGSSLDLPPAFDLARLYFVSDVPELAPTDFRVAYYIGLQGDEGFRYVTRSMNPFALAGIAVIDTESLDDPAVADLVEAMTEAVPNSDIQLLDAIGILLFTPPDGKGFMPLFELASSSPLISSVEVSAETFPVEFGFDEPTSLGAGKKKKIVELTDLTKLTKDLRADGVPFVTEPSLPEPFGPGRIATTTTRRLLATVIDGVSVDVCAQQAAAFEGVTVVDKLGAVGVFVVDATAVGESKLSTLQCVGSIELDSEIGIPEDNG